jgi:hypothetical protein
MRRILMVPALLILATAPAAAAWVELPPVGGSFPEEVGDGGCCARGRGYTFVALGGGEYEVYPFVHATETWYEDFEAMPEGIDYAGAMAYERNHHGRLFVASDECNNLNVYYFNYPWGLDGHWLDPDVQAPIPLPEAIGPGVAVAFQPVENPASMLSGFLYLIPGDYSMSLYRRAFDLVNWAVDGLGPGPGDTVALDGLAFDWRPDRRWTSYQLQVSSTPEFEDPDIDVVVAGGEFQPPRGHLGASGTYYWRVRGLGRRTSSLWSEARPFTLARTAPPERHAQFPPEGLLMAGDEPVFDWPSIAAAAAYRLQVSADPEFAMTVLDVTTAASEHTSPVPLRTGMWYWRTCSQALNGVWSGWSATSSFETDYGWAELPPKPSGEGIAEGGAMCHVIGDDDVEALYILVGNNTQEFWRFDLDPEVWTWQQRASTTPVQTWGGAITSYHAWYTSNRLYALMGGAEPLVWYYNIRNNEWNDLSSDPLPRACGGGSCIVRDEVGYNLTLTIAGEYLPPPTNFYKRVVQPGEEEGSMGRAAEGGQPTRAHITRTDCGVRLHYALAWSGTTEARVFDAAGRLVRTLFSGHQAAGEHTLDWDLSGAGGQRVGAGLYFVALDSEGGRTMMKVPVW